MQQNEENDNNKTEKKRTGKDEMNLAEFPISLLSKENKKKNKSEVLTFTDHIRGKNGKLVKREWIISPNSSSGLPTASADDTLIALFEVAKYYNDFDERKVFFTRKDILEKMGCPTTKHYYNRLEKDLEAIKGLVIKTKNAFYDNVAKRYIKTYVFSIIDEYALYDEPRRANENALPLSFFTWGDFFFNSLKAGYIKNLDTKLYYSLNYPIAKRLLRLLDKRKYFKNIIILDLNTLAFERLGMSRSYNKTHISRYLDRANKELIDIGYLKKYEYKKEVNEQFVELYKEEKRWFIYYYMGEDTNTPITNAESELAEETNIINLLTDSGIGEKLAEEILKDYPINHINLKLEHFIFVKQNLSHLIQKNPIGYFKKSLGKYERGKIINDFDEPAGFKTKLEKEKKIKEIKIKSDKKEKLETEEKLRLQEELTKYDNIWKKISIEEQKIILKKSISLFQSESSYLYEKFYKPIETEEIILENLPHIIKYNIISLRNKLLDDYKLS